MKIKIIKQDLENTIVVNNIWQDRNVIKYN